MYTNELEATSQQNISDKFLKIVDQLIKIQKPGRMFDLTNEPTKDELQFLINNCHVEIAMVHLNQLNAWVMLEGTDHKVQMPRGDEEGLSDIDAHYHPSRTNSLTSPSVVDVLNVNLKGKNIVFDHNGLACFSGFKLHPITSLPWTKQDREKITQIDVARIELIIRLNGSLEKFLGDKGVEILRKKWRELSDKNPLSNFKI